MDLMDVDQPTSIPSSGLKRPPTSPPTSSTPKRVKLDLPDAQLTALNGEMKQRSRTQAWQYRINEAANDDSLWQPLLSDVLMHLTCRLEATDMKSKVIASLPVNRAIEMVMSFSNDVFEQWKVGVRDGVENNHWKGLIEHRTTRFPLISV
jgi:hypothetical protein